MTTIRCSRKRCGATMRAVTDSLGRVSFVCPLCALRAAKLCRDCEGVIPATKNRNTLRCARCAVRRRRKLGRVRDRARYARRRAKVLAHHRRSRNDPMKHAAKLLYMAEWRKANPFDDQSRAYQRVYMRQRRSDPAYREKQNARRRELRALKKRRQYVERAA